MSDRHKTIESSRDVLDGLLQDIPDEYICEVKMGLRRADRIDDVAITLLLKRLTSPVPAYAEPNGDLHYLTTGHWPGSSEEFPVEAIIRSIRSYESSILSLAPEADKAFSHLSGAAAQHITRPIET